MASPTSSYRLNFMKQMAITLGISKENPMMRRIVFHGRVSQGDNIIVSSYLYNPAIIKSLLYNSFLITP